MHSGVDGIRLWVGKKRSSIANFQCHTSALNKNDVQLVFRSYGGVAKPPKAYGSSYLGYLGLRHTCDSWYCAMRASLHAVRNESRSALISGWKTERF